MRGRLDHAYADKLDGKISRDFWTRESNEWSAEEQRICAKLLTPEQLKPERIHDGARILALAKQAHFLYVKQTPAERTKLLKLVVSNCSIAAASVYPTCGKPFDLTFTHGKK